MMVQVGARQVLSLRLAQYEFFAALLDGESQRRSMLARLGTDAADPIDEFMNLAQELCEHKQPTFQDSIST